MCTILKFSIKSLTSEHDIFRSLLGPQWKGICTVFKFDLVVLNSLSPYERDLFSTTVSNREFFPNPSFHLFELSLRF